LGKFKWGIPENIDPKNITAKIVVPAITKNHRIETLSIAFDNLTLNSADLIIAWENTYVSIPIKIPANQIINDRLSKERRVLASDYSAAAFILFDKQQLHQEALEVINLAISTTENGKSFEE